MEKRFPLKKEDRKQLRQRLLLRFVIFAAIILLLVFVLPKVIYLLFPFIFAVLFAWVANPLVRAITRSTRIPRKPVSLVLVILVLLILGGLLFWFFYVLIRDLIGFAQNWEEYLESLQLTIENLADRFIDAPADVEKLFVDLTDSVLDAVGTWIGQLSDQVLKNAGGILGEVSGALIALITFIMAAFFFTSDFLRLKAVIGEKMSRPSKRVLGGIKDNFKFFVGGYIKQQLFLSLISFAVMLLGFTLLDQSYRLLIAIVIAVVDFIPVIGAGVALIPWGIICLFTDKVIKGSGLLIIYLVILGMRLLYLHGRQHKEQGLDALAVLVSLYAGLKIGGLAGAIVCPIAVMLAVRLYKTGIFDSTKQDIVWAAKDLRALCRRDARK